MAAPRERRLKKIKVRTPGGRVVIRFRREKPSKHKCAICGNELFGVPHGKTPSQVRKLSKSERRPERVFGGVLCSNCARKVIELAVYVKSGAKKIEELDIRYKPYVESAIGWLA